MTLKGAKSKSMKSSLYPAQELRRRTMAWAIKLKVNPRVVRLQDMRRKWGSCTTAGTVTLAMDLLSQSGEFQDYVIVHELLHLRYPAHGRLFKACLGAHVPDWRALQSRADTMPSDMDRTNHRQGAMIRRDLDARPIRTVNSKMS